MRATLRNRSTGLIVLLLALLSGLAAPAGAQPDVVLCNGQPATVVGTAGPDVLTGTTGADVIAALGGADRIHGLAGDDIVCAGGGDDRVYAGPGDDVVFGQGGNDRLRGGAGDDVVRGGDGVNVLSGKAGRDVLIGGPNIDVLYGGDGIDILKGADGIDFCYGGLDATTLISCERQGEAFLRLIEQPVRPAWGLLPGPGSVAFEMGSCAPDSLIATVSGPAPAAVSPRLVNSNRDAYQGMIALPPVDGRYWLDARCTAAGQSEYELVFRTPIDHLIPTTDLRVVDLDNVPVNYVGLQGTDCYGTVTLTDVGEVTSESVFGDRASITVGPARRATATEFSVGFAIAETARRGLHVITLQCELFGIEVFPPTSATVVAWPESGD